MAENKNVEINDESMAKAAGGNAKYGQEVVNISGFVREDPFPNNPAYAGVWDKCTSGNYQVYEISEDGRIAVAKSNLPRYNIGDQVIIHEAYGFYGYEIEGIFE